MSSDLWTRLVLDGQMRVVEIINPDDRLFFGLCPTVGSTLLEAAGEANRTQAEIVVEGIDRARTEKRNTCFEYLSAVAGEEPIHVCAHVAYQEDHSLCLYLTVLDTCDQNRMREAPEYVRVQNRYEKLQNQNTAILNTLPVGVVTYNPDGTLLYLNDAVYRILGIDSKTMEANPACADNHPVFPEEITIAVGKGTPCHVRFPFDFKKADDSTAAQVRVIECNGEPLFNQTGQYESYVVIINDVTEAVRQEELLRQSKKKSELAMLAADIMLWEFDVAEKLFYSDNEPLNGYDMAKPISIETYCETLHPEDRGRMEVLMERMSAGEDFSFVFDGRILFPGNPEWQYCSITGVPYERDAEGHVMRYVGTRKNNTQLQRTKLLQENILNSMPVSVHIKDIEDDFRYVFCNEESKRLFGTSVENSSYDVLVPEEVDRIRKTDLEVYKTGESYFGLEHMDLKDGRSYDMLVRKSVIYDNGKRLLLTIRWDQSLQNELQRRAKLFAVSLETMNAFTWFYEPDKTRVSFGDGFDKVGRKASEVNSLEKFMTCVHPDDMKLFRDSLEEAQAKGSGIWDVECRFDLDGNGVYDWWKARGIVETTILNDAPYKYLFGITINIDAHKQAELTLLRNKEELSSLIRQNELVLNNTNSGLAYISTDYIVQWENISVCSASLSYEAYKKGELCYKSAHNRTTPCENCVMQRAVSSRQTEQIKFNLDNSHTVEVFATPVIRDGVVDGIVIRVDNITERERMIAELRQAKARAEQSDKLKSAFLSNMSHEIRTPLNAIVGFSELLRGADPEEQDEYIQIINNNNELLLRLISDILDLSKIEAGSVELKLEEFDLSEYFDDMAASMKQRITNPAVRLVSDNPYTSCRVLLDKNRVAQILTNYVTNAIKYTPKGVIEMGYVYTGRVIRLFVKDSGIGIPDEKKDKVFHRFAKLDEFAQGTGLGLSICKAIAETMGGKVGFESTFGEGSLFWVELPCDAKITSDKSFSAVPEQSMLIAQNAHVVRKVTSGRKTILVAEDIPSNFLLVSTLLRKYFDMLHACNGVEVVEMARNNKVDLVLMDMKMPEMDGLTATAEIRKFDQQIPIVALTAHAFETDRMAALAAGCDEYLVKPIDKAQLMAVLQKYCGCQIATRNK